MSWLQPVISVSGSFFNYIWYLINRGFGIYFIWIKVHFFDITPISCGSSVPSFRMGCFCFLIYLMALCKYRFALATMTLCRCEKADPAVMMLITVPVYKEGTPLPGFFKAAEAFWLVVRPVFQCLEEGFRIRVIITNPGPAVWWCDTKGIQSLQHGGTFHGTAIIRVIPKSV